MKKAIFEARPQHDEASSSSANPPAEKNAGHEGDVEDEVDDDEVLKVEKMMRKLQAVKEAGEGLPDAQRRRMAARAVEEVMKEL